ATLAGCDAIWAADPRARILHCDPIVHLISPDDDPTTNDETEALRTAQFQAWDMLAGRHEPELGGHPRYLVLIVLNYYHDNLQITGSTHRVRSLLHDRRRLRLDDMFQEFYERYHRTKLFAVTTHVGSVREAWINDVVSNVAL